MGKRELTDSDYELMGLPKLAWGSTWKGIKDEEVKKVLTKYLGMMSEVIDKGISFTISGKGGSGKTYISGYLGKVFRANGYTVQFSSASQIQENINSGVSYGDEQSWLERYRRVEVLVIDDLGDEHVGGHNNNHVVDLIKFRSDWLRIIIVNTKFASTEMRGKYGDHFVDKYLGRNVVVGLGRSFYGEMSSTLRTKFGV